MGTEGHKLQLEADIIDSLYRQYAAEIRRFIGRYRLPFEEAQDLAQEVFIRCFGHLDISRPEAYRAFLYKIAERLVIDRARRMKREQKWITESVEQARSSGVRPTDSTDLERALARLPERQRNSFILYSLEGWTLDEIAEIHSVGISTVRRDLAQARCTLQGILAGSSERKPIVAA